MENIEGKLSTYKFSSFSEEMVREAFGLKQEFKIEGYLTDWIAKADQMTIHNEEKEQLKYLSNKLQLFVRGWNEQELREKFIAQIIQIIDFDIYDLKVASFAEREMKVKYNNGIIQGKVEWMVARGIFEPQQPFFFIHEYKKEKDSSNDPLGQLLVTLCSVQILNNQELKPTLFNPKPISFSHIPLYGIYIVGRFWFFIRLKNNRYYVSKAYDAVEIDDLEFIVKMLKAQKEMVIELVKNIEK